MAKILVVDDDPDIVEAVSMFLKKEGHDVASAGSRSEGMKQVESYSPDLIVLDVMMEEADDGIAMAQDLRRQGFTAPILMLTSINRVSGLDYGKGSDMVPVDAFEEKPVEPEKLMKLVQDLLSGEGNG
jgi:DNA-binding response OmpR family regulator